MKRKLSIEGMKCSHCVGNLKDVLVDMGDSVDVKKVQELIEDLGFQLTGVE